MQVAGAEVLVAETIRQLGAAIRPVVICLDAVGALGEQARRDGVEVVTLDRQPGFDWGCVRRMSKEVQRLDLDVLHAHQYTPFFYAALGARLARRGTRVILTEHGRHYPDVVSARRRWTNRLVFSKLAARVTSVCEFSARALAEKDGFAPEQIEIIENGIDLSRYAGSESAQEVRRQLGLDPNRRYIGCIARFHPVKDHRTLIDAYHRVSERHADVDLVLVGDGPLRGDLETQARALGLANRVHFLGVRSDVPVVLRALDIFALTSVSEAASITLLEAMATNLPVVVTAVGGNPEIVRAGEDGLLAPRGDANALGEAFHSLLSDPVRARAMGANGARRVQERYRLDRTISQYWKMYVDLAHERSRTHPTGP